MTWCIQRATAHGWVVKHVPAPMRAIGGGRFVPESRARGLCDLVLLHPSPARMILAETKDEDGKLSDDQIEFLRLARAVADAFRLHLHAVREVLEGAGVNAPEVCDVATIPLGVYIWRPGMEALIEATLKSKVMVR